MKTPSKKNPPVNRASRARRLRERDGFFEGFTERTVSHAAETRSAPQVKGIKSRMMTQRGAVYRRKVKSTPDIARESNQAGRSSARKKARRGNSGPGLQFWV